MLVISQDGTKRVETNQVYGCFANYSIYAIPIEEGWNVKVAEYRTFDSMLDALMSCQLALNNKIKVFQFPKEEE